MFEGLFDDLPADADHHLDGLVMAFDRPLEPCPECGGLLSRGHLEAADAGWLASSCHRCGVVLAA